MKVYIVNVNNCEAYSDYHEGNRGIYLTYQDAVDAMTELGFDPSTRIKIIPWYEDEEDWRENGWYDREAYRIEEWELPERTCEMNHVKEFLDYEDCVFECWECSACKRTNNEYYPEFCPYCGAKVVDE